MARKKERRLVELTDGIRLVITDHGLDYGNRFTADVYAANGNYCGSLGSGSDVDEKRGVSMLGRWPRSEA